MSKTNSIEESKKLVERYLQVPIHRFLGASLVSLSLEACEISFNTTEQLLTPADTLHAGAIYTALELANVIAVLPHLRPTETAMSIDHSVSLIGTVAGKGKQVIIRSRLLKRGGTVAFFESEAYDASDMSLLAKGKTTKAIRKLPKNTNTRDSKL